MAALLGLEAGAKAFLRQRLLSEETATPAELASIWLPLELAAGTDLASPDLLRVDPPSSRRVKSCGSTTPSSGYRRGSRPGKKRRCSMWRPTTGAERIVTAYDATARPVQVTDLVLPGDRHEIHDAYPFA